MLLLFCLFLLLSLVIVIRQNNLLNKKIVELENRIDYLEDSQDCDGVY